LLKVAWFPISENVPFFNQPSGFSSPTFALVSVNLQPYASKVVSGTKNDLLLNFYQEKLNQIDFSIYDKKPVILKGCSNKPVPQEAYVLAIQKLIPFAKSIMFGEACSAVPLFKSIK